MFTTCTSPVFNYTAGSSGDHFIVSESRYLDHNIQQHSQPGISSSNPAVSCPYSYASLFSSVLPKHEIPCIGLEPLFATCIMFIREPGWLSTDYTALCPSDRTHQISCSHFLEPLCSSVSYGNTVTFILEYLLISSLFLSLFSLFWKNKVGLWDHGAVRVCVCVWVSPLLTFERLNQSLWNLVPEPISTA
jgi:hypothetical protein